ncbi:MAG: Eco57I restriction-modification methylase domain-containing protein, partial [Phycisphaerae bacterium]
MASAPSPIPDLVETFHRNRVTYTASQYNETQVRREFIDPLFTALGWDVDNTAGYAQAYKDVIHEDAIKIGGATKAPDYCFRIGGTRKFFVEAKKPSVNIKADAHPAYQVRRYAWSAKLPLSILTDFEELAVYDCRIKPAKTDAPGKARVKYLKYTDYVDRWDEIASIFSRDAILKGSFDKFAESNKRKRGTAEVDAAFLAEIEEWRMLLARNFALRNKALTARELNYAVQVTIDRIIFLRMCEDRSIEPYGRLQGLVNGPKIYARLFGLFREADQRYNSGLFHFEPERGRSEAPDDLTPGLTLDDKVIKDILTRLYYPDCPYEFSVLPADILGQVYEQFLGQVIVRAGRSVKIEPKPEVKKAGGVYYTPTYIVDYIVKHTVGKLLEGKTPKQAAKLRIVDPACGSGSFLLGAYQCLLDFHLEWYRNNDPEKHARKKTPPVYQKADDDWRLTASEKKRILLNNIHGVDIDTQAVEVTKLSLLLKVLEGETAETVGQTLRLFHERALPDLANNIKCGNSLIGPDFYENQQLNLLDEEERYRINAFDWHAEFAEVFNRSNPGFDAVIGNPPYIRSQTLHPTQRDYFRRVFRTATATFDIYVLFVEHALALTNSMGRVSYILPNKFFTTDYGQGLRRVLGEESLAEVIVDFEDGQIFVGSGTYTALLFLNRAHDGAINYASLGSAYRAAGAFGLEHALCSQSLDFKTLAVPRDGSRWSLAVGDVGAILPRLQDSFIPFVELGLQVFQGLKTSADKLYMVSVQEHQADLVRVLNGFGQENWLEQSILQPVVKGEHVHRYAIDTSSGLHIIYPYSVDQDGRAKLIASDHLKKTFPKAWAYLNEHRETLGARDRGKWSTRKDWYAYARGQNIGTFLGPKLLVPYMTKKLRIAPDLQGKLFFVNITTGGYGLRAQLGLHHLNYAVGLLNSTLMNCCISQLTNRFRGGYFAVNKQALERLPFRVIDFDDTRDADCHERMVTLVQQMLDLHEQLAAAKTPAERTALQRQITATDNQIDQLV